MILLKIKTGKSYLGKEEKRVNKITYIQALVAQLNQYRHEYYNLNKPIVSDVVYDQKFDELQKLEKEAGFILSNSPTQTVGYEVMSKLQKVQHPITLKSLDKTKSIQESTKWIGNQETLLMLKADGLTIELDYDNGKLIEASTRGNGEIGELVTHNAKVFKNIPLTIPFKGKLSIAGEAVIHKNDFNEINSKLSDEERYATPRNLVAGSVRQLDSKVCAERNVYFYVFNILSCSEQLSNSKEENFGWLLTQGFTTVLNTKIGQSDIGYLETEILRLQDLAEHFYIPIDGMVLTYDSVKYSNSLSETSHHPLHSLAYKFSDETEESVLRSIEWNTTRTGQVNPTAIFDTVLLDNTEVSRASLFNLTFIEDMQLNINSRIKVAKRNMIIPYIEENLDQDLGVLEFPKECPACGGKTEIRNTGTADFLFCTNGNCQAKLLDKFVHFVKRDCMNIEGLSEATLEKLINLDFIRVFGDIYRLEQYKNQIIKLDGFGKKSYNNLITSIEKSKNVKLDNFITALGIEGVGVSTGKLIAKKFKTIYNFINARNAELLNIEGIGNITAESILQYRMAYLDIILDLIKYMNFIQEEKQQAGYTSLEGKTFVVTGDVQTFKNRNELGDLIVSLGGKLSGSVSKNTNHLINNDVTSTSGKNQKAKQLGVPIISETDFNRMIGR